MNIEQKAKAYDETNLLKEIEYYNKEILGGQYITYAMYKKIARHFYFLGKKSNEHEHEKR